MKGPIALYRASGQGLYLEGATGYDELFGAAVTQYRVPSRSHVSNGTIKRPYKATIQAEISQSPGPGAFSLSSGPRRWREVVDWLRAAQAGELIRLQVPGRPLVRDLVLADIATRQGLDDVLELTIAVEQIQIARTSTVQLAPRPPRPDKAAALSPESDGGDVPTSIIEGGLETIAQAAGYLFGGT